MVKKIYSTSNENFLIFCLEIIFSEAHDAICKIYLLFLIFIYYLRIFDVSFDILPSENPMMQLI
ncbi:MAG: hypothetical protein DAHOPDDO_02593 [Ignavibacteriaceae bacterium]|nr:hypothetical protein [Ignavibacteriaceae bacterium]